MFPWHRPINTITRTASSKEPKITKRTRKWSIIRKEWKSPSKTINRTNTPLIFSYWNYQTKIIKQLCSLLENICRQQQSIKSDPACLKKNQIELLEIKTQRLKFKIPLAGSIADWHNKRENGQQFIKPKTPQMPHCFMGTKKEKCCQLNYGAVPFFSLLDILVYIYWKSSFRHIVLKTCTEISHLHRRKKENRTEMNGLKTFLKLLCSQSLILLGHFTQFLTVLFPI